MLRNKKIIIILFVVISFMACGKDAIVNEESTISTIFTKKAKVKSLVDNYNHF